MATLASSGRGGMLGIKGRDDGGWRTVVIALFFLGDRKRLVVRWIVQEVNSRIARAFSHASEIYQKIEKLQLR